MKIILDNTFFDNTNILDPDYVKSLGFISFKIIDNYDNFVAISPELSYENFKIYKEVWDTKLKITKKVFLPVDYIADTTQSSFSFFNVFQLEDNNETIKVINPFFDLEETEFTTYKYEFNSLKVIRINESFNKLVDEYNFSFDRFEIKDGYEVLINDKKIESNFITYVYDRLTQTYNINIKFQNSDFLEIIEDTNTIKIIEISSFSDIQTFKVLKFDNQISAIYSPIASNVIESIAYMKDVIDLDKIFVSGDHLNFKSNYSEYFNDTNEYKIKKDENKEDIEFKFDNRQRIENSYLDFLLNSFNRLLKDTSTLLSENVVTSVTQDQIQEFKLILAKNSKFLYQSKGTKEGIYYLGKLFASILGYQFSNVDLDQYKVFSYRITCSLPKDFWNKNLKPLMHPVGWNCTYIQTENEINVPDFDFRLSEGTNREENKRKNIRNVSKIKPNFLKVNFSDEAKSSDESLVLYLKNSPSSAYFKGKMLMNFKKNQWLKSVAVRDLTSTNTFNFKLSYTSNNYNQTLIEQKLSELPKTKLVKKDLIKTLPISGTSKVGSKVIFDSELSVLVDEFEWTIKDIQTNEVINIFRTKKNYLTFTNNQHFLITLNLVIDNKVIKDPDPLQIGV